MANNQISESLFRAMDILTSAKLNQLEFDKTLVCTIESVVNAEKGEYQVTDGVSHFKAYSDNTTYSNGTKVYVNIPNGDMGNQKMITGKYIKSDTEQYYTYTSPLNDFVDITNNLINYNYSDGLVANGKIKEKFIWELNDVSYVGYERLGLRCEFMSWLNTLSVAAGSYGLRLDLIGKTESGGTETYSLYLDASDMYGNPYNFEVFYEQEKGFDISNIFEITDMRLVFYQYSDFINIENNFIAADEEIKNLFIQNPYVSLGYNTDNLQEDKIFIGSKSSLSYSIADKDQARDIYMRWVHNNGEKFIAIDSVEEIPEEAQIHWYRYKLEQNRADEVAGALWKNIDEDVENKFNYSFIPDYNTQYDKFKVIIEIPSREYINNQLLENEEILNLATLEEIEKIIPKSLEDVNKIYNGTESTSDNQNYISFLRKVIAEKSKTVYYSSDVIEFSNEVPQDQIAIELIKGLTIEYANDEYNGVYRLYNETNSIINSVEANINRVLKANYTSVVTGEESLTMAEEIIWYIPITNTMIQKPIDGREYNKTAGDTIVEDREGYFGIKRLGAEIVNNEENEQLIEVSQIYRIKDYYTQNAKNNTIYCVVKKNGLTYEAEITLSFGINGSNGTEATFLLIMTDENDTPIPAITAGGTAIIKPELYNYNNKQIEINNIQYSWLSEGNQGIILENIEDNRAKLTAGEIADCYHYILKAVIPYATIGEEDNEKKLSLTTFLPIAIRKDLNCQEIEGATKIIYDSNGTNPTFYKDPYKLYFKDSDLDYYLEGNIKDSSEVKELQYYPVITKENNLIAPVMFYQGLNPYSVIFKNNNRTLWVQPILIQKNKYASSMLNQWDGELTFDENNGTILSAMVGAGVKNIDNTFSGVLMGDVKKADLENGEIGLYGFDHGKQSYGFKVDGTAFIGKSGKGRIDFDGNKGTITSGNYTEPSEDNGAFATGQGMLLDLDDSIFNIYGSSGSFNFNANSIEGEDKDLLVISNSENKKLLNIGDTGYYLQSSDFIDTKIEKNGLRFDLNEGSLMAYKDFNLFAGDDDNYVQINSEGNPYFEVKTLEIKEIEEQFEKKEHITKMNLKFSKEENFILGENIIKDIDKNVIETDYTFKLNWGTKEGDIPIDVNGVFKVDWDGSIDATSGTIGGWTIYDNSLFSGDTNTGISLIGGKNPSITVGTFKEKDWFSIKKESNSTEEGDTDDALDTTSVFDTEDNYFKVNKQGQLEVVNAKIKNLAANTINTNTLQIKGRRYKPLTKKITVNFSGETLDSCQTFSYQTNPTTFVIASQGYKNLKEYIGVDCYALTNVPQFLKGFLITSHGTKKLSFSASDTFTISNVLGR